MKRSLLIFFMSVSACLVQAEIAAKVITNVTVQDIKCESLTHSGHDWSGAGSVSIKKESGGVVQMSIFISRNLENEKQEADLICNQLKDLKRSGQTTDIIYTEDQVDDGSVQFRILGTGHLPGANRLNEG